MLVVVGDGVVKMISGVVVVGVDVVPTVVLGNSLKLSVVVDNGRFLIVEYLYLVVVYFVGSRVNNGFGVVVARVASVVVGVVVTVVEIVVAIVVTGCGLVGGFVIFVAADEYVSVCK